MITMWDNIEAATIPADAQACAGYIDGFWPDARPMQQRFPQLTTMGRVITITTQGLIGARCLDVENGNPTAPTSVPSWVVRSKGAGVWMPTVYANASTMPAIQTALNNARLTHGKDYLLWVADWTYSPHLPAGFDACQWTDKAGPNDESLCLDGFFPAQAPPLAEGVFNAAVHFDGKIWHVNPLPGTVKLGAPDAWDSAEVQVNRKSGEWRVAPMPLNAPPLGK